MHDQVGFLQIVPAETMTGRKRSKVCSARYILIRPGDWIKQSAATVGLFFTSDGVVHGMIDILEGFIKIRRRKPPHLNEFDNNLFCHFQDGVIRDWFAAGLLCLLDIFLGHSNYIYISLSGTKKAVSCCRLRLR